MDRRPRHTGRTVAAPPDGFPAEAVLPPYPGTVSEVRYPFLVRLPPLALGDGTWLTTEGDTVHRWQIG